MRDEDLGYLLRSYRHRARLSQQALADLSAVSVRAIRDLESGRVKNPRRETVKLLADGLRVEGSRRAALEAATGPPDVAGEPWALRTVTRVPVPTSELVGRGAERELLRELVGSGERLVAVVGLGGVGKTRLVMEVANELRGGERAVLWAAGRTAADLLDTEVSALASAIGQQPTVLVLDGYDTPGDPAAAAHAPGARTPGAHAPGAHTPGRHAGVGHTPGDHTDAVHALGDHADAVHTLLHRCRRLCVLVTARRPHHASGWRLLPLAPLRVPAEAESAVPEQSEAGRLLARHLRHARPGFTLDATNATMIADLCRQADGIPAALEMVAQWSVVHRLEELREELSRDPAALSTWPASEGGGQGPADAIRQAIGWLDPPTWELLAGVAHLAAPWSVRDVSIALNRPVSNVARQVHTLLMLGLVRRRETPGGVCFEALGNTRRLLMAGLRG
ncbi:helix-turn-helix domain-containing protein [Nonomuraea sp. NPDC050404]|uniref:helix-turn-helix domain-containing protein n=1 Tax=Nonomuraea sp. NPDC050404 TaxID=3155783 RepID=UPI0033D24DE7